MRITTKICDFCDGRGHNGYYGECKRCTGNGVHVIATVRSGWENQPAGGVKYDAEKPRMDLIDGYAMEELAKVLTFGAQKYAPNNWRKGITFGRLIAAAFRHLTAIMRGQDRDEETGLPHAAHLMCCAMFLVWMHKYKPEMDDRYAKEKQEPAVDSVPGTY